MPYALPRATLGRTGLEITRFGIGGCYCETADGYRAALDCGVNYIDTARAYREGEDEKVIGQALQGRAPGGGGPPARRANPITTNHRFKSSI